MTIQCKYCPHLEQIGRMQTQRNRLGRKKYYCKHPGNEENRKKDKLFFDFVGYGDMTSGSPLTLKTSKKWCVRKNDHLDKNKKNLPNKG